MGLDGFDGDRQLPGHLFIGVAPGQMPQDLLLARSKLVEVVFAVVGTRLG